MTPVTSPSQLAQEFTGLDTAARQHLERLMATWGLLADLSFSDLLLYVPLDQFSLAVAEPSAGRDALAEGSLRGLHFVVFGQMRPTTSQTLLQLDLVGQVVAADELPVAAAAWQRGEFTAERLEERAPGSVRTSGIPVRFKGEVIAVLSRIWSPTGGRRTGGLERVYLQLFDRLAAMVASGIYPFLAEDEVMEEAPRAGDGVIVLDAEARITFASPNAVNALHRMGILAQIAGSTLEELGADSPAVKSAFEHQTPVIEELERRPEVIVLVHCIPLIEEGEVSGAVVLLRDVTDLRRRDRLLLSKDAAIREVHHRVKNNLQTISSLLRLQSRRLDDATARNALLEAERRIRAIALVHEILAREPGEQVRFDEIVPELIHLARDSMVSGRAPEVLVLGDAGDLLADVATPLAVVIAELLQNAVEHAFNGPEAAPPLIEVRFRADASRLDVEVRDNGSGFAADFDIDRTRSLGLAIVRDLVRSQLGGSITVANEDGACVYLAIPLRPGGESPVTSTAGSATP
jgi:two-component sensor histidine kinase